MEKLRALLKVGPTRKNQVIDHLAVQHLDNQIFMISLRPAKKKGNDFLKQFLKGWESPV